MSKESLETDVEKTEQEKLDALYIEALAFAVECGETSVSFICRQFPIGYKCGEQIVGWMEKEGYVAPFSGEKSRKVLATKDDVEILREKLARGERIAPQEEKRTEKSVADAVSSYQLPKSVEENPSSLNKVYLRALQLIVESNSVSLSMLQEKLDISYNKAWQILGWLEECGYITPFDGDNPRKVLIAKEHFEKIYGDFV